MTTDEVLAALAKYGILVPPFPLRLEPDGDHPGDKVYRFPVPLADGRYLAVSWSFGQPNDDELRNWEPVWHAVDGPMTRAELEARRA